jgi:hypothetical protein
LRVRQDITKGDQLACKKCIEREREREREREKKKKKKKKKMKKKKTIFLVFVVLNEFWRQNGFGRVDFHNKCIILKLNRVIQSLNLTINCFLSSLPIYRI